MTGQTKKNKPNRRAAALCLALLLCVSAAGCSAGETPSSESAAPAAAETAPEATPEATPEAPAPAEAEAEAEPDSASAAEPAAGSTVAAVAAQDVPVFVPNDSGLTQYTLQGETTDAAALVEKMAEKGAFPADVVLEALDESDGVVRLQFSGALQSYIDGASSAAAL